MAAQIEAPSLRQRRPSSGVAEKNAPGGVHQVSAAELSDHADKALAAEFGYKPVFKREFGYLSTFSFAVSISGLFATVATTFSYPLSAGGPASAVWSWAISGAGCLCVAFSVSEIVSAYPTCGGLYYSVSRLAPPKYVPSISWYVGWLNLLGQVAGVASSEYGASAMLLAAVSIGTDFTYFPTTGETIAVMAALTVLTGIVNSLSTRWMERMTKFYVIFHIAVLVSCCIALLVVGANTDNAHDAKWVFTHTENTSGWTPAGWAFMFGFLSVSWTMTDYDATAHITEEIKDPEIKAPWAISMAMIFTYVGGFFYNIVLCFRAGDPAELLASSIAQPVAQLFYNNLGKTGGIVYTVFAFIIIKFVCFTAMQSLARTVFAFSRDKLLPASQIWTRIMPLTGTPILAVWISTFFCIVINLIGLGSYTAIAGVFNVCAIALDWSYCIPIFCKLYFNQFQPGPWHMGKFSWYVNAWACIWTFFVTIIFVMPTVLPVTADNMNYAIVYLAGILVIAGIYWHIRGRTQYSGPLIEAALLDTTLSQQSDEDMKKSEVEAEASSASST